MDQADGTLESMMTQDRWKARLSSATRFVVDESLAHSEVEKVTVCLQRLDDLAAAWGAARDCFSKWNRKARPTGLKQFLLVIVDSVRASTRAVLQNFDTIIATEAKALVLWLQDMVPAIARPALEENKTAGRTV